MTTHTRRHRVAIVFVAVLGLAGCAAHDDAPAAPTPSVTTLPDDASAATSPELLARANLTLPGSATGVQVTFIEDDYAYDASVTTFTAPRADVEAMCPDAGVYPMEDRGVIDFEAELLGEHAPQPGDVGCRTTVDGIASFVGLSEGDPTEAAVLVYDMFGPDRDADPEDR